LGIFSVKLSTLVSGKYIDGAVEAA